MEPEAFDRLVGDLYNTVVEPSSWIQVLRDLRDTFDASHTSLQYCKQWSGGLRNQSWSTEPALSAEFNRWSVAHERVPVSSVSLRVGEVATDDRVVERQRLAKTAYFNEILIPFDASKILFIKIAESPGPTINLLRGKGQAEFSDAELALARRLSYHAVHSIGGLASLGGKSWAGFVATVDEAREGIVLVDDAGDVLHANTSARSLLAAHDGIRSHGTRLGAVATSADRRLRQAIGKATGRGAPRSGSLLTIERASGSRPLIVRVTPVTQRTVDLGLVPRLGAIVSILDPERAAGTSATEALREAFGITRREAEIVDALAQGLSVAEAGTQCGVTLATARNYLARALRKTDLHRQADLVLLVQRMSRLGERSGPAVPTPIVDVEAQTDSAL